MQRAGVRAGAAVQVTLASGSGGTRAVTCGVTRARCATACTAATRWARSCAGTPARRARSSCRKPTTRNLPLSASDLNGKPTQGVPPLHAPLCSPQNACCVRQPLFQGCASAIVITAVAREMCQSSSSRVSSGHAGACGEDRLQLFAAVGCGRVPAPRPCVSCIRRALTAAGGCAGTSRTAARRGSGARSAATRRGRRTGSATASCARSTAARTSASSAARTSRRSGTSTTRSRTTPATTRSGTTPSPARRARRLAAAPAAAGHSRGR